MPQVSTHMLWKNDQSQPQGLACYLKKTHSGGMIVCQSPKFIYMKTAKTGGTSIFRGVLENMELKLLHNGPEYQEWLAKLSDDVLQDYFIFSVTRNPWDRVVSIAKYFDLEVGYFLRNFKTLIQNNPKLAGHSLTCSSYTHLNGTQFADYVCRNECLQFDLNVVFDRLGLPRRHLRRLNQTQRTAYYDYFSKEDSDLVKEIYADDIKNFGYCFEDEGAKRTKFSFLSHLRKYLRRAQKTIAFGK